jgi:hypothetical protein
MQHARTARAQARERGGAIEVADDGHDAVRAQLRRFVAAARETIEPRAASSSAAARNATSPQPINNTLITM